MKILNSLFILQSILYYSRVANTLAETATPEYLVPDVMKCNFADSSCFKKTAEIMLKTYSKSGIPKLNLFPFDPLRVNALNIKKDPSSPVYIELEFKDIDIIGLQAATVIKITGFDADVKDLIEIKFRVPRIELKGHYSVNGSVLILPIIGQGNSQIVLDDVLYEAKLHPEAYIKEGQVYIKVTSRGLDQIPNHVTYNLENLFNGDKVLSDIMNKFINENWSELFNEVKDDLSVAFGALLEHLLNQLFSAFPYESLFLK